METLWQIDGALVRCGSGFEAVFGVEVATLAELIALVAAADRQAFGQHLQSEFSVIELTIAGAAGPHTVRDRCFALPTAGGGRQIVHGSEIVAPRELMSEARGAATFTEAVLDALPDPVFVKDREHRWVTVNLAFCSLMGRRRDELLGKSDFDLVPLAEAREFWEKDEMVFRSRKAIENVEAFTDGLGTPHIIATKKAVFRDSSGNDMLVAVIRDITEFHRTQEALRRTHGELVEMARSAGRAEVAAAVLHNVGNVLNSVAVTAHTLRSRAGVMQLDGLSCLAAVFREESVAAVLATVPRAKGIPPYTEGLVALCARDRAELVAMADELIHSVEQVNELVQAQQRFAKKVQARDLVDLDVLVREAVGVATAASSRSDEIVMDIAAASSVHLDRQRVLEILVVLMQNAIEGVAGVAAPQVHISARLLGEKLVRFTVLDNGAGIPADDLPAIFRAGFTTKKRPARGFGLHHCCNSARHIGGALAAHSDGVGRGAVFTLDVPCDSAAAQRPLGLTRPLG